MTSDEERAIELECARLIARYANLNDAGDWEAVADLYAEDGRMARPSAPDVWIEGREAILEAFRSRPARKGRHLCTNIVIEVTGPGEARGECALALFTEGGPPKVGSFRDRFIETEAGWKFAERHGSLAF